MSRFLDLPYDIRFIIYSILLIRATPIVLTGARAEWFSSPQSGQILRVRRSIYRDAIRILYGKNTYQMPNDIAFNQRFAFSIGLKASRIIKRIIIAEPRLCIGPCHIHLYPLAVFPHLKDLTLTFHILEALSLVQITSKLVAAAREVCALHPRLTKVFVLDWHRGHRRSDGQLSNLPHQLRQMTREGCLTVPLILNVREVSKWHEKKITLRFGDRKATRRTGERVLSVSNKHEKLRLSFLKDRGTNEPDPLSPGMSSFVTLSLRSP